MLKAFNYWLFYKMELTIYSSFVSFFVLKMFYLIFFIYQMPSYCIVINLASSHNTLSSISSGVFVDDIWLFLPKHSPLQVYMKWYMQKKAVWLDLIIKHVMSHTRTTLTIKKLFVFFKELKSDHTMDESFSLRYVTFSFTATENSSSIFHN